MRLKKDVIKKIEADDYPDNEISVYMRGYIRNYARYLEISDNNINEMFLAQGMVKPDKTSMGAAVKPLKFKTKQTTVKDKKVRSMSYVVVIVLIILLIIWHFQKTDNNTTQTTSFAPTVVSLGSGIMDQGSGIRDHGANIVNEDNKPTNTTNSAVIPAQAGTSSGVADQPTANVTGTPWLNNNTAGDNS